MAKVTMIIWEGTATRQTITLYETGIRRIPLITLLEISKALHVHYSQLIPEQEKKKLGRTSKVSQSFEKMQSLNEEDQQIVFTLLDSLYRKIKDD